MDAKTALKYAEDQGARFLSLRFTDLVGAWHHLSFPIQQLSESSFEDGFGFDASSLRGWASIHESDMLLVPDPVRMWMDPFTEEETLCLIANAVDPITKEGYGLDPRSVARRAESYLRFTGLADTVYFGPEAEFFVFDNVRYRNEPNAASFSVESDEAHWSSGRAADDVYGNNLGYRVKHKEGYVPVSPVDSLNDLRAEMALTLEKAGIQVECHHHEVAPMQCEIDIRYSTLLGTADNLQLFKYIIRNTAHQFGKSATFMPKPLYGDNGSGMHCHQSLWKNEQPLFAGDGYAGLSDMARFYIGGLLKHAAAVVAFAAPTTNSYKRLVPGFEAPVNLAYSATEPLGGHSHPDVFAQPQAQAAGVSSARPVVQPLLGLFGDALGRTRRHPEPD